MEYKVGQHIKSPDGTEYLVSQIFNWPDYSDLDLINTKDGSRGYLRIQNKRSIYQCLTKIYKYAIITINLNNKKFSQAF